MAAHPTSQQASPEPSPGHRTRRFISPPLALLLSQTALLVGMVGAVAGIAYAINGATQAGAYVTINVRVTDLGALTIPLQTSAGAEQQLPLRQQRPVEAPTPIRLTVPGAADPSFLEAPVRRIALRAWDSTVAEQLLSRSDAAVLGLCVGLGGLLLARLLRSIAQGRPFQPGNPARIAGIAALVLVAGIAADVLPAVAGTVVLHRLGLDSAGSPIASLPISLDLAPALNALVILALAEAFRRGGDLAQDVEGLV